MILALTLLLATLGASGAGQPYLFSTNDSLLASWVEPVGKEHALKFAEYRGGKWSEARTIVQRGDMVANWADFPSIARGGDGTLYAHFLRKTGDHAYETFVTRSSDGGSTWSEPLVLHRDRTKGEHGFVSVVPAKSGVQYLWISNGTIQHASLAKDGAVQNEVEVDGKACECCATGMAMTAKGPIAAYRDRLDGEIRDISVARLVGGKWTAPKRVHADGWKFNGCPVNGPQIDAAGNVVAVAWFTGAAPRPRVQIAWSNDGGATFSKPAIIDDGKPLGRVDVTMTGKDEAVVTWLENGEFGMEIRARRVRRNGKNERSLSLANASRTTGVPRIAKLGEKVFVTYKSDKGITVEAIE